MTVRGKCWTDIAYVTVTGMDEAIFRMKAERDETKRTETKAAEAVGMSRPTYRKAKAIVEAAESNPKLQ